MTVSGVSPSALNLNPIATAAKAPVAPASQAAKPAAPPAMKQATDSDGDNDRSGINVKA
jgi:hypothetical protein